MTRDLSELREEIDRIDKELIRLFVQRMDVSLEVGEYKRANNLPVFDAGREQEVIAKRVLLAEKEEYRPYVEQLMRSLMEYSKEVQKDVPLPRTEKNGKVVFQGIQGAYSEEAVKKFFGNTDAEGKERFEDVFLAVFRGEADYGVVPVENSATGSVTGNYDLLGKYKLWVAGEVIVPIHHVLLGVPGANTRDVSEVYSHEQGFLQCSAFLEKHKDWMKIPYHNTAVSAKFVADSAQKAKAAIASAYAGEVYGLDILEERISDTASNYTRFFVISKERAVDDGANKASLLFTLKHASGSLARALDVFAAKGYNLTKIESRPMPGRNWEYRFYADLEGDVARLAGEIGELSKYCLELRLIGLYRKAEA